MHQKRIAALEAAIRRDHRNIAGIIVRSGGTTVCAQYYHGSAADTAWHVFSVTKSIVSALIGIAIDQGKIKSIDQKVLDFFPAYTPKRGEQTAQRVTLRDMLTMTAPFKYKSAPYTKYFTSPDWVASALDLLGGRGRIGQFRYTPLIGPDILSGILTNATGRSVREFAAEYLFRPLGIKVAQNVVFHSKAEQLALMKDHHASGWVADPQGTNTAGWGLFITTAAMAAIGQLYLHRGSWQGRQLVSARWIDESTHVHSCRDQLRYGYLWWIIDDRAPAYAALGDGGNVIYVNAKTNLVVAITARFTPLANDRIALIREYIEPFIAA